jgi:hypothetical protein
VFTKIDLLVRFVYADVVVDTQAGTFKPTKALPAFTMCGEKVSVDSIAGELAHNLTGRDGADLPGRSHTKKMFRDQVDNLVYGTPEKIEKDVQFFVDQMTSDRVRGLIKAYIESLSKKK